MNDNDVLLLVPTQFEADRLTDSLQPWFRGRLEICGFGVIAAAARTALLLEQIRPRRVVLCGIAGAYDGGPEVGTAWRFRQVGCDGIGVGSGNDFISAEQLGWLQWRGAGTADSPAIGDTLSVEFACSDAASLDAPGTLLTCCAASASLVDAAQKCQRHPDAVAEDMEGFAVAAACRLAGVPLDIVRGISNQAGNRDHSTWQVDTALQAAANVVRQLLSTDR
ncbi:MAG: futalosine hydrolase [Planctomycetaceae bacterium]|nr:futalosine hydrolase [Planctomycetaceae bacterium]